MDDPTDIRGWQRLAPDVTTSGRLLEDDPERLAALGVRRVVNLALDDHPDALRDESARLDGLGVEYVHIPVPFDAPDEAHYAAFRKAIADRTGPVHVHCIMNWRVSAFFYLLHLEQGMAEPEARALMARQWNPLDAVDPRARPWADFITRRASAPKGR